MNKFLIGLVIGIAIAGGLAVYLNNAPTEFIKKNVTSNGAIASSSPLILAPGTKIEEVSHVAKEKSAASTTSYDFYEVLQARHATNSSDKVNNVKPVASKPKDTASAPAPGTKFYVQAGAFSSGELASDMKGQLALLGIDSVIASEENDGKTLNRVLIGPMNNEMRAQKIINKLSDQQIHAVLIRVTK